MLCIFFLNEQLFSLSWYNSFSLISIIMSFIAIIRLWMVQCSFLRKMFSNTAVSVLRKVFGHNAVSVLRKVFGENAVFVPRKVFCNNAVSVLRKM